MTQLTAQLPATTHNTRSLPVGLTWTALALTAIAILAAGLRLVNAEAFGDGNTYYTAAVANMLESPSNFFYAVADSGGVTVDKPPVALWIQAIFAAVLGVSGFSVTLPSIIAGTLSVLLLYHLVSKWFGSTAGLISALVLAITPVAVAVDRTNNLDSILIFTLLLATWAFVRATETGKWQHLLLGAALIGVAFNVKMLQAYLIIPALYALYFFGASIPWRRKFVQLGVATAVLLAVSLSWALIVELTPEGQRPYVGGSETNSVIELAFGYNGMQRLLGADGPGGGGPGIPFSGDTPPQGAASGGTPPQGPGGGARTGGPGGSDEIGTASVTRLFETALANELAWLLPFSLLSIGVLVISRRITLPFKKEHQAVMLWGGWLVTGVVFFSVSGFFHAYYLATLAPALAAMVGIGVITLWRITDERRILGLVLLAGLLAVTLVYQIYAMGLYDVDAPLYLVPMGLAVAAALGGLALHVLRSKPRWLIWTPVVAALVIVPGLWGTQTALASLNNAALPAAYAGGQSSDDASMMNMAAANGPNELLADYIEENGTDARYDLIVSSSMMGSQIVLDSDLDVLFWGGFGGQDNIYSTEDLDAMQMAGELGFILSEGSNSAVTEWAEAACSTVDTTDLIATGLPSGFPPSADESSDASRSGQFPPGMPGGTPKLYDCSVD